MLLPEDIYNRSPGFCLSIPREEAPSSFPVGCPTDGLPELPQDHCLVKAPRHGVVLLLAAEGGPSLAGSPFRLGISYYTRMLAPFPEFHAPGNPSLDLPGPADAKRLGEYDVGEDEGSLGVPTP